MHHFATEMCACVCNSGTKWCIKGYLFDALWDLWDGFLCLLVKWHVQSCEISMMTSSNGNIFCINGHLCRELSGHRWIPQSLVNSPHKGQWCRALMFSLICAWINHWEYNREADDLRCHHARYDVIIMEISSVILKSIVWFATTYSKCLIKNLLTKPY